MYQLTTDELRAAAAQRLGVNDSLGLSRAQLIGVIRQRSPQPEPPPSKGLFGRVMGIAKKAIQSLPDRVPGPVSPFAKATEDKPDPLSSVASAKGGPAVVFDEPIVTQTMARILAEQGHFKRSIAMYGSLMRERPFDDGLKDEALNVRTQARARLS